MSLPVEFGKFYYEISEETHNYIVSMAESDPDNAVWGDLLEAFNYQSVYVPGKWYAPTDMIDTDPEFDWAEAEDVLSTTYWFRQSQQPGGHS